MAARKLQNEIDKVFKKVGEGIQQFDSIYEKINQTTNPSQKEKLEDTLKKEIKKLQRSRDQIKSWAASGDIKDKKPLLEQRRLIESRMEMFKAVEKEMKTKAYSKEGLQNQKLDPKEREKHDMQNFLSSMVEDLDRQVEQNEAEIEQLGAVQKKGRKDTSKADRQAELEKTSERHKWHQSKIELIMRALENGSIEADSVKNLQEDIKYYVENNAEVDFMEDENIYDDLDLQEEEDLYAVPDINDRDSSHDSKSIPDDNPDIPPTISKPKQTSSDPIVVTQRRPSIQMKSPLPALAALNSIPIASTEAKPVAISTAKPIQPSSTLKYASAAAAAAAAAAISSSTSSSDKNGLGIPSLPPPAPPPTQPPQQQQQQQQQRELDSKPSSVRAPSVVSAMSPSYPSSAMIDQSALKVPITSDSIKIEKENEKKIAPSEAEFDIDQPSTPTLTNGDTHSEADEEESVYHLPSQLSDLLETFEMTKTNAFHALSNASSRSLFISSGSKYPDNQDSERPQMYRPQTLYPYTPSTYPQQPLSILEDPRLYTKVDTDTLFYSFYYKQGTYQQWAAARALKSQSWRFHKQYQTWFQRHEEPKDITEDYEQGTYRFFDYESTWMNRRKADFKFHYRYLEDDC